MRRYYSDSPLSDRPDMASPAAAPGDTSSGSVHFCPLCKKPFTLVLSYRRHLAYCRRAQQRPRSRRVSCQACSAAKVKCSFHMPCSRCTTRGVKCIYVRPASADLAMSSELTHLCDPSLESISRAGLEISDLLLGDNGPSIDLLNLQYINQHPDGRLDDVGDELALKAIPARSSTPNDASLSLDFFRFSSEEFDAFQLNSVNHLQFLTRLCASEPLRRQSANLVMEALCAIPEQMTRRATFPPFVHPYWNRQPMPEPLSICMRIAQMFAARTPDIMPFIWRIILAEQRRVLGELPSLSKQDILAAIQAQMVYFLMRVGDGDFNALDWNQEMATSMNILCEHFLDCCDGQFSQNEQAHPSTTWDEWVFAESRRRTSCVWFLITRTIVVKTKAGCPTSEDPSRLALPSPKTQWEARSYEDWMEELQACSPSISTFGDLIQARQRCNEPSHAQRLDSWNARTDSLGQLLNIAVAMV